MTNTGPDDAVVEPGFFAHERRVIRELWFPAPALEVFQRWCVGCASLTRLRPGDASSADFTADRLVGGLWTAGPHWLLHVTEHDAGLVEEIAERALADGVPSVAITGDHFAGEAPFVTFTARVPGRATRTLWFDPLRGLTKDEGEIVALVERISGKEFLTIHDFVLAGIPLLTDAWLAWVTWMEDGRVLDVPRWRVK